MRFLTFFLTFLLVLTACAPPTPATTSPVNVSAPESDTPTPYGTFETSLLVTEWKGSSKGNILYPLDPASGTALPAYAPISLGIIFSHAFSPDKQTLAVMSFPNDNALDGSLLLIDLPTWKTQRFELELSGWINRMVFSPDGRQLAIAHGNSFYRVTLINIGEGTITAQSQIDSFVSDLKFTKTGKSLMLYGPTTDPTTGMTAAPPGVLLLDAADLSPLWSVELQDVHDGIFPKDENVTLTNIHEPGQAFYLSPGLAFAPDRDILYIVHADREQLTTVDFENRIVKTVEIKTELTWFEQFLAITAGVAHAKIADGISRQAVISPDGELLYVVGMNSISSQEQGGNWEMHQTPLGLEILRVSDGSRVAHIETDTTELSLSPDGRLLYLRNWGNNQTNIPWTEIYDTSTWQLLNRKTEISGMPALLVNGEFLLVSTYSTAESAHHMSILESDGSNALAAWTDTSYTWWLTAH